LRCSFCRNVAVYKRPYEGAALCKRCFLEDIEEKIRRTVSRYGMLKFDDHVAVAVSGGKDSLTMLRILWKIERRFSNAKLTAVTVDEGIRGYRAEAVKLAKRYCRELEVDHVVVSFHELFGTSLDQIAKSKKERSPCSYCGVLRRRAIHSAAKKVKANKIATAHNLDDEVQTVLLNLFHGDAKRIARVEPVLTDPTGRFLERIKPLCEIPEKEVALYAHLTGVRFQTYPCPYLETALRNDVREMLNRIEERHPGTKFTILRSAERLRNYLKAGMPPIELKNCKRCGEPTTQDFCEVCKTLDGIVR
jgi:uncharacterized protein (TIGR00269 family)